MSSKLNPYINFNGNAAKEAMEFYKNAFGGQLTMNTFKQGGMPHDQIEEDGSLELPKKDGDKETSFFSQIGYENPETLMHLAQQITQRFPHLRFSFEGDPEGRWLKYTVRKN